MIAIRTCRQNRNTMHNMHSNSDKTTMILPYYWRYHCYDNTANNNTPWAIKKAPLLFL